jgi:proline iminopeptidase
MRAVFPEAWRVFAGYVGEERAPAILAAYHARLVDPDPAVHMGAAGAWSRYESACSRLMHRPPEGAAAGGVSALGLARIEAHYFVNRMFLPADDYLMANAGSLVHLPAVIVQGRYDMICPPLGADELARAWSNAEYVVVADAGHSAMEPGIRSALVVATEKLKVLG